MFALEVRDQVGEIVACSSEVIGTGFDLINSIFLGIGVQIAHDDEVRVATAGRVGGEPIHQGFRRGAAGLAAIALTVAKVRVAHIITSRTFRFEVVDNHGEARAGGIDFEGLRQRWAALGVDEARVIC